MNKLSVISPVFNEALYIEEYLRSFEPAVGSLDFELLVIDDWSTDETYSMVAQYMQNSSMDIRLFRNPKKGKVSAINYAFEQSSGTSFIFIAGDDLICPDTLIDRVSPLAGERPQIVMGRLLSFSEDPSRDGILFPRAGSRELLSGGAVAFNRSFAEKYFPIPEELPNEDTWLRACVNLFEPERSFIEKVVLRYRLHDDNSVGIVTDFTKQNRLLIARNVAYSLCLERFPAGEGSEYGRKRILALASAEELRRNGRWLAILFQRDLSLRERASFAAESTSWLYRLKFLVASLL